MAKYSEYSSARPFSGSHEASLRLLGVLHSFFGTATSFTGNESSIDPGQIGTAVFMYSNDFISIACQKVECEEGHEGDGIVTTYGGSYRLGTLNPEIEDFLKTLPHELEQSFRYMIKLGIKERTKHSDAINMPEFNAHTNAIWQAYDLTDPRLSKVEGLLVGAKRRKVEPLINPECSARIDMRNIIISGPLRPEMPNLLMTAISQKNELKRFAPSISRAKSEIAQLHEAVRLGPQAAKTLLYSRVISPLRETQHPADFRQRMFDALVNADGVEAKAKVISSMIDGLPLAKSSEGAKQVKEWADYIAADFEALHSGSWAISRIAELEEVKVQAEEKIEESLCWAIQRKDNQICLTEMAEDTISAEIRRLLSNDHPEELTYLNVLLEESGLPRKSEKSLNLVQRVAQELCIVFHDAAKKRFGDDLLPVGKVTRDFIADETNVVAYISATDGRYKKEALQLHKAICRAEHEPG